MRRLRDLYSRHSLRYRLTVSYLVILGIGGLATSIVGSWIVSSTIMDQARRKVDHDLGTARMVYDQHLLDLERTVLLTASSRVLQNCLNAGGPECLLEYMDPIRRDSGLDFFSVADPGGRVLYRVTQPSVQGDDVSSVAVIRSALNGTPASATEILSARHLENEDPGLLAQLQLPDSSEGRGPDGPRDVNGMTQVSAAPLRDPGGRIIGVLYGGVLLNRSTTIVDRVWDLTYKGEKFDDQNVGMVTIFQEDTCVSSNLRNRQKECALGTRLSSDARETVLGRGGIWRDRDFFLDDWYISAYEPIRNLDDEIIGILYVGLLEKAYTSIRNNVILAFFGIASVGFFLIILITYTIIRSITQPLLEMAQATRSIAAGKLDTVIRTKPPGEIGLLAESFDSMLKSIRQMRADLEEWGRTLEEKVEERTEELVAMQAKVAESERLASIGKLAAGVAHEINNPLSGILSLTHLALEDLPEEHPNREELEEVIRQTERCRDIVRGLLDYSRQSVVRKERVDLNKVLQNTLSLVERQALFLDVTVYRGWDPQLPAVMADESQLQQVFMNIIMNGVQAMDGHGSLTIMTRHNRPESMAEVLISDTGCGIPADKINRIFDPFYSTKQSGVGTGLGLSIAYGIISKHGGAIEVESTEGKGTLFTVRIPAAEEQPAEDGDGEGRD